MPQPYPEAAEQLDKLANSPHITKKESDELHELAQQMRENKSFPIYGEAKAMTLVVSALIARAGGIEKLLTPIIGADATKKILEPFQWMARVKKGMSEVSVSNAGDIAKDAAAEGKALTQKGLELFKKVALHQDAGQ